MRPAATRAARPFAAVRQSPDTRLGCVDLFGRHVPPSCGRVNFAEQRFPKPDLDGIYPTNDFD